MSNNNNNQSLNSLIDVKVIDNLIEKKTDEYNLSIMKSEFNKLTNYEKMLLKSELENNQKSPHSERLNAKISELENLNIIVNKNENNLQSNETVSQILSNTASEKQSNFLESKNKLQIQKDELDNIKLKNETEKTKKNKYIKQIKILIPILLVVIAIYLFIILRK